MATAPPLTALDFRDIDDLDIFKSYQETLQRPSTESFAVCFNADYARCAAGLDGNTVSTLLDDSNVGPKQTRWLCFWGWDDNQRTAINVIAEKYDLSPRLAHLLCPKMPDRPSQATTHPGHLSGESSAYQNLNGLEKAENQRRRASRPERVSEHRKGPISSIYEVADELWHFCSVDWGKRYLYVGFNALFTVPGLEEQTESNKPTAQRIWTSLLLCDDGTVVSVFETPRLGPSLNAEAVRTVRQNQLNVFRHLSKITLSSPPQNALLQVTIRPFNRLDRTSSATLIANADSASLLFYSLFDDWTTTYSLVTNREHPYYEKLEDIRRQMFDAAAVPLIESLHQVGRQLVVLKLMYQSYQTIITQILQRQRYNRMSDRQPLMHFSADTRGYKYSDQPSKNNHEASDIDDDAEKTVRLPMRAIVRFERLLDRIKLYAITDIEQCLNEKESLVFMNFNLVTLKESQAIEKMTRTTILLAKATILFLPVSLMTAYFSMEIAGIVDTYSLRTYWLSFLVVVTVSILLLFAFGLVSGTVEGKTVYKSLTRMLWEKGKGKQRKKKSRKEMELETLSGVESETEQ